MNTIHVKGSFKIANNFIKEGGIISKNNYDNQILFKYYNYLILLDNKAYTILKKIRSVYLFDDYLLSINKDFNLFSRLLA